MSRFKSLVSGLTESSPQIKGTLESWGRELNELRANPVGNERRMQELSDNIKSTVEANAKRVPSPAQEIKVNPATKNSTEDIMKKVSGFGVAPAAQGFVNPVDTLKAGYEGFESARGKVSDALANQVTGYLPETSKEKAIGQARNVMNTATDPLNYIGGVGAVDLGLGAASAIPDEAIDAAKARFKGLFGN